MDQRLTIMSVADFKKAAQSGELAKRAADAGVHLRKMSGAVLLKAGGDSSKPIRYRISNGRVDRDDDTVRAAGWKLADYNGVILFGHDSRQPAIGKSDVAVEGDDLMADAFFTPRDLYAFGGMIGDMVRAGFMPSASVGFKPKLWTIAADRADEDDAWSAPMDFLEQELLEWSVVTVPSNPDAGVAGSLALSSMIGHAKHAGIDVTPALPWAEELLAKELGQGSWIPRKDLETIAGLVKSATVIDLGAGKKDAAMAAKDTNGSEIVTMAAHLQALGEVKDAFSAMHAEHKAGMADLHAKLAGSQDNLERLHKAMTDICAKMSAIVGSDANGDLQDPPTAPAPTDDSSKPGKKLDPATIRDTSAELEAAKNITMSAKGSGAHALSGEQYRRVKAMKKTASEILSAHHAADGDEDSPDEEKPPEKSAGTALEPVKPAPGALTAKDASAIDEVFSRGKAALESRIDSKVELSKRALKGKPN